MESQEQALATRPIRPMRPALHLVPSIAPPPLPKYGAVFDPVRRGWLLRSLGAHEQQIELAKFDLARVRRALAGIVRAVEAARGAVDRQGLDLDVLEARMGRHSVTPQLIAQHHRASREYARARRELEARLVIEAERREDVQVYEQKLKLFRSRAADTRRKLVAVAA